MLLSRATLSVSVAFAMQLGCSTKKGRDSEAKATPAPSRDVGDEASPKASAPVISIDGKESTLSLGNSSEIKLLSVEGLPPVEDWNTIEAVSVDGRRFFGSKPILLTGVRTMVLVENDTGRYDFRVMDVREGKPYVRHKMEELATLSIQTKGYNPPAPLAEDLRLIVGHDERAMDDEFFADLPTTAVPGESKRRGAAPVWAIADLAPDIAGAQSVVLRGAGGEKTVNAEELADESMLHLLKRNRQGQFNYRVYQRSQAKRTYELRSVTEIVVTPPGPQGT